MIELHVTADEARDVEKCRLTQKRQERNYNGVHSAGISANADAGVDGTSESLVRTSDNSCCYQLGCRGTIRVRPFGFRTGTLGWGFLLFC
jgi:hypothetical protein